MNVIPVVELELTYYEVAVQHISRYATGSPFQIIFPPSYGFKYFQVLSLWVRVGLGGMSMK